MPHPSASPKKSKSGTSKKKTARPRATTSTTTEDEGGVGQQRPVYRLPKIKVFGIGGGGGNAISRMADDFPRGVEFVALNTDEQDLNHCAVKKRIYIGKAVTRGLGAGMNPDLGRQAAEENRGEIVEAVKGADLIFIAAGMGGGTGTGASPVIAEIAKHSGALTIAVVTKPFLFEGQQRMRLADEGLAKLKDKVDALIVIPNDRIFSVIGKDTSIMKAFQAIDDVLRNALRGIVELLVTPGLINVDFADVRTIMADSGAAIVGIGIAAGKDRALQAMTKALTSPLLEVSAEGAQGVLLGVSGGRDMTMSEISEAAKIVQQSVDPEARIIFGAYFDRKLKQNQIKVTLIATGFGGYNAEDRAATLFAPQRGYVAATANPTRDEGAGVLGNTTPFTAHDEIPPARDVRVLLEAEERVELPSLNDEPGGAPTGWDIPTFLRRKKK